MTADSLLPLGIFLGLGFLTQICEVFWPLRRYSKPKALRLDLVGFAVTILARITIEKFQVPAIERLPRLPAFAWMTEVSRIVEWRVRWPIALLVSVVVLDFLLYIGHRLLHTSLLWHTHAAHHSVEHLYWFAGNRASPFHVAALAAWGTLLGLVWPVNGGSPGLIMMAVIYSCIQHFNHANLSWRLGFLGWLFVTPRYHFVHHGAETRLNGSNFGFLLTIWDRMFGTYTSPAAVPNDFPLGLTYRVGAARMWIGLPPGRATPP